MSLNVFSFTGNLGRDAEVKQAGGSALCNFAVAVSIGFGDKKQTMWVSCNLWGKQAEGVLPSMLTKGQQVAVSGELSQRTYQANDGTTKTVLEVRVVSVQLIGGRSDSSQQSQQQQQYQQPAQQQQPRQAPQMGAMHNGVPVQQQPVQQQMQQQHSMDDIPF